MDVHINERIPDSMDGKGNMKYDEAIAWLNGERSMCNIIPQDPLETWLVRTTQADAAMTEQAYWVAKAHKDGLLPNGKDDAQ